LQFDTRIFDYLVAQSKSVSKNNTTISISVFEVVVATMIGRREREGPLMRNNPQSLRKSRIVTAVVIGVLIGCILAFFFPNGFFVSQSIASNRRIPVVGSKTQVLFSSKIVAFVFFFHF